MIIDYTYFTGGKLSLPQTGNTPGRAEVEQFISDYEPEYLQKALGYGLWKAFTEGISGSGQIEQRWLNLLEGAEYTYRDRVHSWVGFAPLTAGGTYQLNTGNVAELTVGGPGEFDPVAGLSTMTLPPAFVGVALAIYIRGTGRLLSTEYSVTGNQLTLLGGPKFETDSVIFLEKGSRLLIVSGTLLKKSPIANYVFCKFVENNTLNVVQIGTATSETDNNRTVNPTPVIIAAWNPMVEMNMGLYRYLETNKDLYPEWTARTTGLHWDWWPEYVDHDYGFYGCFSEVYRRKNRYDI